MGSKKLAFANLPCTTNEEILDKYKNTHLNQMKQYVNSFKQISELTKQRLLLVLLLLKDSFRIKMRMKIRRFKQAITLSD